MKILLLFGIVGAVIVAQTEAQNWAKCNGETYHPQQHYCKSGFAVRVSISEIIQNPMQSVKTIKAVIVDSMKLDSKNTGDEITIYSPTSSGTYLYSGKEYVITGRKDTAENGSIHLYHGSCDFAKEWDDLSPQQQKGFTEKYARYCDCTIQPSNRSIADIKVSHLSFEKTYPIARTYWTPDTCYFNPHKSRQYNEVEDCEEEYGYCAPGIDGECSWQLTPDYEGCFEYREVFVQSDIERPNGKLCNILPRRRRRACRKRFRKYGIDAVIKFLYGMEDNFPSENSWIEL